MDPLSIIASSIAVGTVLQFSVQVLCRSKDANADITALAKELSDLMVVLQQAEETVKVDNSSSNTQLLVNALLNVQNSLGSLKEQASKWTGEEGASTKKYRGCVKKPIRWVMATKTARKMRDEFRSGREQLVAVLSTYSALTSSQIRLELQAVHSLMESIHATILSSLLRQNTATISSAEGITIASEDNGHGIPLLDRSDTASETTVVARLPSTFQKSYMDGRIDMRLMQFPRPSCVKWCSCTCHKETRMQSPRFLDTLIGTVLIGYSGMPISKRKCDQRSCQSQSTPFAYATYMFPQWLLAQMMTLVMSTTPYGSPMAALMISRTIPAEAEIFVHAKSGDVAKIQELFTKRLASPNDVHYKTGVTALHFAIAYQRLNVCKLLLEAGADPFLSNKANSGSAADKAWSRILSNAFPPESERALREMFSGSEALERREFSVLHKIVVKLCEKPLKAELEASTAAIDARDSLGRTPLSLAAERGDAETVATLLEYGANPTLAAYSGSSPLRYAATSHKATCVKLLLNAGADVRALTNFNQTALHYAAGQNSDPIHARLLLEAGADPNAVDNDGRTPLGFTPVQDNYEVAQVLFKHGAKIGRKGNAVNPLVLAIQLNRHRLLELFLQHEVSTDLQLSEQQTILHVIAEHADQKTVELLSRLDYSNVDIEQVNADGLTASQLLAKTRGNEAPEMMLAFVRLLNRSWVMETVNVSVDSESEEAEIDQEDIVWEDAMETQAE